MRRRPIYRQKNLFAGAQRKSEQGQGLEEDRVEISINDAMKALVAHPFESVMDERQLRMRFPMALDFEIRSMAATSKEIHAFARSLAEAVNDERISRLSMQKALARRWPDLSEASLRWILVWALPSPLP